MGVSLEGWLTIIAIVLGPILALWAQRISDRRREAKSKTWVFRELMATRTARLSARHVEALNLIDLEYDQKRSRDRTVLDAWRLYLDSLSNTPPEPQRPSHFQRRDELFVDVMYDGTLFRIPVRQRSR